MEDKEVQDEYEVRIGQKFPGALEEATHVDRFSKRVYRKNGQFADLHIDGIGWIGSAFGAQELDDKDEFTLI